MIHTNINTRFITTEKIITKSNLFKSNSRYSLSAAYLWIWTKSIYSSLFSLFYVILFMHSSRHRRKKIRRMSRIQRRNTRRQDNKTQKIPSRKGYEIEKENHSH